MGSSPSRHTAQLDLPDSAPGPALNQSILMPWLERCRTLKMPAASVRVLRAVAQAGNDKGFMVTGMSPISNCLCFSMLCLTVKPLFT